MSQKIPVTCDRDRRLRYMSLAELDEFQGDLKDLDRTGYVNLRDSILKHGFVAPVMYWQPTDPDATPKILDGHQRKRVVQAEGWEIEDCGFGPGHVPVIDIQAQTEAEAGEILLQLTGMHGTLTDDGLYQFLETKGLGIDAASAASLPGIDMEKFEAKFYDTDAKDTIKGEIPLSPELFERHDYVVFAFDNEFDWQVCSEFLELGTVTQPKHGGTTITKKGTGRVLSGKVLAGLCGAKPESALDTHGT